jgi:hypothetical protein
MELSVIYAGAGFFKALHVRLIGNVPRHSPLSHLSYVEAFVVHKPLSSSKCVSKDEGRRHNATIY